MATALPSFPEYLGGAEITALNRSLERIARAIIERKADFMFGAGMSFTSGVPMGKQLAIKLLSIFFPGADSPSDARLDELTAEFPFETVAEAIERTSGLKRADLTRHLLSLLVEPGFEPKQEHSDFLTISMWDGQPRLHQVFTTNFDPLLDKSFGGRGIRVTEENTREIPTAQKDENVPIIYLHGTLESTKYQITEVDVFDTGFKSVKAAFRSALNTSDAFVFVGYSMNDPDFRSIYQCFREEIRIRGNQDKKTYVVSPAKDKYSYALGKEVWAARGADWFPLTAEAFFQCSK